MKNQITTDSSRELKTANEGSNIEQMLLPFRIQTQYRAYVFVRLKKDKKCVRPVIHAYGTDPEEICKAATEAFDQVRNGLIHKRIQCCTTEFEVRKGRSIA
jgi:hypothetical protein